MNDQPQDTTEYDINYETSKALKESELITGRLSLKLQKIYCDVNPIVSDTQGCEAVNDAYHGLPNRYEKSEPDHTKGSQK